MMMMTIRGGLSVHARLLGALYNGVNTLNGKWINMFVRQSLFNDEYLVGQGELLFPRFKNVLLLYTPPKHTLSI